MAQSILDAPIEALTMARPREAWGAVPSIARTDLERIFADIIDTAITNAASIPCSIEEYREGLGLMLYCLEATIASAVPPNTEL